MRTPIALVALLALAAPAPAQVLDRQKLLDSQTFWDNRDWDWYKANVPFFECPDADIQTTYYYRWELLTKHLTYGSPDSGYSFTEFIDRPFWSGAYGSISCPAGHQLYEARWLRHPRYARDYLRYWFRTPGAQPRRYSTWLADAAWAVHCVWPDDAIIKDLLPDLKKNYEGWEKDHFVKDVGLFWQTGHDDGMEININSRQTKDAVRGAPGFRPTLNAYLYADALAIARIAKLAGDADTEKQYKAKAAGLKENLQKKLWDPKRTFFLQMYKQDEVKDGDAIKALSLTYQTGKYAGNEHGREEIGYVPWQFNMPDAGYEAAWKYLMDPKYFYADRGPTTVERNDPLFKLSKTCCWWSGQSWPYATTQTLVAMANLLNNYKQDQVTKADYVKLLTAYAKTHRKDGKPYIAEACHPDSGSWDGHDSYNHSEHYFHSGYCDLIITGLVGLRPRDDDTVEVNPLVPDDWDYFALDGICYHDHRQVTILWDRTGKRYGQGAGFHILVAGKKIASAEKLQRLTAKLPPHGNIGYITSMVNYAVNNDGRYYPHVSASYSNPKTPVHNVNDGTYWYHQSPPNRWTCEGTKNSKDWIEIDFGIKRRLLYAKLYFLDDGKGVVPPEKFEIEYWDGKTWVPVANLMRLPEKPAGRQSNAAGLLITEKGDTRPIETEKIRAVFTHARGGVTGLTEFEAWGSDPPPYTPAPSPAGNLALNERGKGFPKASASYTSRFDKVEMVNDGIIFLRPTPHNRWTSYESPNASDWLEIDFGEKKEVGRVELYIFDDGGGVQAPEKYAVQSWDGSAWQDVAGQKKSPEAPAGGVRNTVTFPPLQTAKVRVVFTHKGKARSGLSEIEMWPR
jgi:hypothetical protein